MSVIPARLFTGDTETQRFEEKDINALGVRAYLSSGLCVSVPPVNESNLTGAIA